MGHSSLKARLALTEEAYNTTKRSAAALYFRITMGAHTKADLVEYQELKTKLAELDHDREMIIELLTSQDSSLN